MCFEKNRDIQFVGSFNFFLLADKSLLTNFVPHTNDLNRVL